MWCRIGSIVKSSTRFTLKRSLRPSNAFTRTASTCQVRGNDGSILIRTDDIATGVTTLTLNRPEKLNVLTWEMLEALQYQLNTIAEEEVRLLL